MAFTHDNLTRRRFIGWSQALLAAFAASPAIASASAPVSSNADDYYARLGVQKIINAYEEYDAEKHAQPHDADRHAGRN